MIRPRIFDVDAAVDTATDLFWRQGYEGTSLSDLTGALGITPPSFYHAFGSKEALFRTVLERYGATRLQYAEDAVQCATAREVAEQMLTRWAELYTEPGFPAGCLAFNCSLAGGGPESLMAQELVRHRDARRARLRARFEQAQQAGDLAADANPEALARYLMVLGWGMASDARTGASRQDLLEMVAVAMQAWPA
ncbi:TetR/AcrR family transcriptional regulator [Burkholderia sp. 22PA0106]|uniref:TetR/AcrR family transcriptional regulator n=1 Tax=Burkholderia sp. 22PA0106 TaxID=3237371 RepID=UPI0039C184E5